MKFGQMTKGLLALAASLQCSAFADILVYGQLDPNDASQKACVQTISSIPYSEAVIGMDGKYIVRLVQDVKTGVITTEVYARSIFAPYTEKFVPNVNVALRTENTKFELSPYEGHVRDVVTTFGDLKSNLSIVSEWQTSVDGLNPRPAGIVPLTRSELSITHDQIQLTRVSLMKSQDIGIRIPMVVAKSFRAVNCTFERTY